MSVGNVCGREARPRRRCGTACGRAPAEPHPATVDLGDQQVRPAVEEIHRETRSAGSPIATIIRHDGSMPSFGERRKVLRFSALRVLTGKSWAYLKVLQTAYKQLQLTEFE